MKRCPRLSELPPPPPGKTGWPWTEESAQLPDTMLDGRPWPGISIVTPSYNQANYLEETIRAILLQGYPQLEYIISEDCSTDHSLEVIRKYEAWLTLVEAEKNEGMSAAINRGFKIATGNIITWISSDDVYLPGAFAEVGAKAAQVSAVGVITGAFYFMNSTSKLESNSYPATWPFAGAVDLTLTSDYWRVHQVSTFYMRHALDAVGCFVHKNVRHNPDRELLYRVVQKYPLATLETPLAAFRQHDHSKSWSVHKMVEMARDYANVELMFLDDNESHNRQRRRAANKRIALKGYVRYAKYSPSMLKAMGALLVAGYYWPPIVLKRLYYITWLKALRLLGTARCLKTLLR